MVSCGADKQKRKLVINDAEIAVEIADTTEKQKLGLSGRESLPETEGMLFVFPDKRQRKFWMKDMKFAIDIIWIDDNRVVEITKGLQPPRGESIPSYTTKNSVDKALEVNAGFIDKHDIKVGDVVK